MTVLAILFALILALNLIGAVLPLLFWSPENIRQLSGWQAGDDVLRLLGVAFAGLSIAYFIGFLEAWGGWMPRGLLLMAAITNGGLLPFLAVSENPVIRGLGWCLAGLAAALLICFVSPDLAMSTI